MSCGNIIVWGFNMKKKWRNGQSIVELAIVFPFFLLIIVGGMIDFGFAFYNLITLQQLADDVAMYAAESNGTTGVSNLATLQYYVTIKSPSWWKSGLQGSTDKDGNSLTNVAVELLPDVTVGGAGGATVKRVHLTYYSRMWTPFWQSMVSAATGISAFRLDALAAYQVPKVVATR